MARANAPKLRQALKARAPSLAVERSLWDAGHEVVVGMDEVGRGGWAGRLTLGAAVVPRTPRATHSRASQRCGQPEPERRLAPRRSVLCPSGPCGRAVAAALGNT